MKKIIISLLLFPLSTKAFCPVCSIAVVAGVGLSRWLKIDDAISGVWVGAMAVSLIFWIHNWMKKKNYNFKLSGAIVAIAIYALTLVPLYWKGIIGHPLNTLFGIDRLLFGIIIGSIIFLLSILLHLNLKKNNQGKVYFSFQGVVISLSLVIITSLILYLIL